MQQVSDDPKILSSGQIDDDHQRRDQQRRQEEGRAADKDEVYIEAIKTGNDHDAMES